MWIIHTCVCAHTCMRVCADLLISLKEKVIIKKMVTDREKDGKKGGKEIKS